MMRVQIGTLAASLASLVEQLTDGFPKLAELCGQFAV
jgi:hypothetical protein